MQKGREVVDRTGADCHLAEAESRPQGGLQEEEVHSARSEAKEDPCYQATPYKASGWYCLIIYDFIQLFSVPFYLSLMVLFTECGNFLKEAGQRQFYVITYTMMNQYDVSTICS